MNCIKELGYLKYLWRNNNKKINERPFPLKRCFPVKHVYDNRRLPTNLSHYYDIDGHNRDHIFKNLKDTNTLQYWVTDIYKSLYKINKPKSTTFNIQIDFLVKFA